MAFIVNGHTFLFTDEFRVNGTVVKQVNCNGKVVYLADGHTQTPPPPHDEPMIEPTQNDELESQETI